MNVLTQQDAYNILLVSLIGNILLVLALLSPDFCRFIHQKYLKFKNKDKSDPDDDIKMYKE